MQCAVAVWVKLQPEDRPEAQHKLSLCRHHSYVRRSSSWLDALKDGCVDIYPLQMTLTSIGNSAKLQKRQEHILRSTLVCAVITDKRYVMNCVIGWNPDP